MRASPDQLDAFVDEQRRSAAFPWAGVTGQIRRWRRLHDSSRGAPTPARRSAQL